MHYAFIQGDPHLGKIRIPWALKVRRFVVRINGRGSAIGPRWGENLGCRPWDARVMVIGWPRGVCPEGDHENQPLRAVKRWGPTGLVWEGKCMFKARNESSHIERSRMFIVMM